MNHTRIFSLTALMCASVIAHSYGMGGNDNFYEYWSVLTSPKKTEVPYVSKKNKNRPPRIKYVPGGIQKRIVKLCDREQARIWASVYWLCDKTIAEALVRAHEDGVDVSVVTDASALNFNVKNGERVDVSATKMLHEKGVPVCVYDGADEQDGGHMPKLMHDRFGLFFCNDWLSSKDADFKDEQPIVAYGSANWTGYANSHHCEYLITRNEPQVFEQFKQQHERERYVAMPYEYFVRQQENKE